MRGSASEWRSRFGLFKLHPTLKLVVLSHRWKILDGSRSAALHYSTKKEDSQLTCSYSTPDGTWGQRSAEKSKWEGYDRRGELSVQSQKKEERNPLVVLASGMLASLSWRTFSGSLLGDDGVWTRGLSDFGRLHTRLLPPLCCGLLKDPPGGACPVCLSLLPANAPVPSNTDKYCPNPELSLHNRDHVEGTFCCE